MFASGRLPLECQKGLKVTYMFLTVKIRVFTCFWGKNQVPSKTPLTLDPWFRAGRQKHHKYVFIGPSQSTLQGQSVKWQKTQKGPKSVKRLRTTKNDKKWQKVCHEHKKCVFVVFWHAKIDDFGVTKWGSFWDCASNSHPKPLRPENHENHGF